MINNNNNNSNNNNNLYSVTFHKIIEVHIYLPTWLFEVCDSPAAVTGTLVFVVSAC